jgi:hypothetical protein
MGIGLARSTNFEMKAPVMALVVQVPSIFAARVHKKNYIDDGVFQVLCHQITRIVLIHS